MDALVAKYVARGWAVESRTESQAVLVRRKKIRFWLNLILSLITGGLWLIVVIYNVINRKSDRKVITLLPSGEVKTT